MEEHSRKKLTLYKSYLTAYLSVLTNQPHIKNINIVDLFAGVGITDDGHHGSAVIAARKVQEFRQKKDKNIRLFLNEYELNKYNCLVSNIRRILPDCDITKQTANVCFSNWWTSHESASDTRTLFFIDPYGYTQFSHENMSKLLQHYSSEILIFVPISHILRFKDATSPAKPSPVKQFLRHLGIDHPQSNHQGFAEQIKNCFKEIARDVSYVYRYMLKNEQASNTQHCLFFITHNPTGADKFIEAMYKIRKYNKQGLLFDYDAIVISKELTQYLSEYRNNGEINEWRRKKGYHYPEIKNALKQLENEQKLEIRDGTKKIKGAFYLDNKDKRKYFMRVKS